MADPTPMRATEIRDELDRIINEFGDGPCFQPDAMESEWRLPITGVDYEPDREAILISSD